jgi:hypothetical protein
MKPRLPLFLTGALIWVILGALACLLLAGCQSTPVQLRPAQTNVVEVVRTNVVQIVQTNTVVETVNARPVTNTVVVTNLVTALATNVVTLVSPPVFYTNVSLSPLAASVTATAGGLAPVPWGGAAASVGLGLLGSFFGLVNERRRRKALGEAMTWQETAGVLVENVESVRKAALQLPGYTAAVDLQVVRGLEAAQRAAGVKDLIHGLVEERTDDTVSLLPQGRGLSSPLGGLENPPPRPVPIDPAPQPGDPPNRSLSAVMAFANSGQPLQPHQWSAADLAVIRRRRDELTAATPRS